MRNLYVKKISDAFAHAIESEFDRYDREIYIKKRFMEAKTICFWGTGEHFNKCYKLPGFDFDYVCDNDSSKWGKTFKGKRCISIEELKALQDPIVLVMVADYFPIQKQLNELKIENYNFDDIYTNAYDSKYNKKWFQDNLDKALYVVSIFEDEVSREIYTEAVCNRIAPHLATKIFNQLKSSGEYFGHGLFDFGPHEVMVDAGAYDGDTILKFIEIVNGSFDKVYAFEIEKDNFNKMCQRLAVYNQDGRIQFINKGVWSHKATLKFAGKGIAPHISDNAQNEIDVVSIDEVVQGNRVTFIKMDVEGSELPALEGASEIIKNQSPKLAISAYHYLSDLWNVPLKIKEFNPKYKIYLRHHTANVGDTDCYACI